MNVPEDLYQRLDQCAAYPYRASEYARRLAWQWVQRVLVRPSPGRAHGWRRALLRQFGAQIHKTAGTKPTTHIWHPWLLSLGEWSMLSQGVVVYNLGPVQIGAHSVISQDVYLCAGTHDHTRIDLPLMRPPIVIGSGVWIGAGAFIGPGVTVGDNAIVAARAVVVKDVPPGVIVGGNPAHVIKQRPRPSPGGAGLSRSEARDERANPGENGA